MPRSAISTGAPISSRPIGKLVATIAEVSRSSDRLRRLRENEGRAKTIFNGSSLSCAPAPGHDFHELQARDDDAGALCGACRSRERTARRPMRAIFATTPRRRRSCLATLLISVTAFFRDHTAFEALVEEAIAPLLRDAGPDGQLRDLVGGLRDRRGGLQPRDPASGGSRAAAGDAARPDLRDRPRRRRARDGAGGALPPRHRGRCLRRTAPAPLHRRRNPLPDPQGGPRLGLFAHHSALKDPPFIGST